MTSVVTSAGSPLDDYFRDEGESAESSLETDFQDAEGMMEADEGDITLVSPDTSPDLDHIDHTRLTGSTLATLVETPRKGWTGVIDSVAGPSRPPSPTFPGHFDPSSATQSRAEDDFAEQFKYVICSSGILEKDYLPGPADSGEEWTGQVAAVTGQQSESPKLGRRDALHRLGLWSNSARNIMVEATRKWDISLAGLVLLAGLCWISGAETILWIFTMICLAWGAKVITDRFTQFAAFSDTSRSGVLAALSPLLAASREIDSTFDNSLSRLAVVSSEDDHHDLRLALHRATLNLVDHFATATSSLSTLINHSELAVLADMYDVQLRPTTRTRPTHLESSEEEEIYEFVNLDHSLDSEATLFSPSSRLRIRKAARSRYASTSMSVTQSSPGRLKQSHMRHLSLASSANLPRVRSNSNSPMNWTPRDKFTSLPPRTPRESKRVSLDPAMWNRIRNDSEEADDVDDNDDDRLGPSEETTRFPGIPEADGSSSISAVLNTNAKDAQSVELDGFLSEPVGSSPTSPASNVHRYSPFRTSPLADRSPSPGSDLTSPIFPSISAQLLPTRSRYSLPITTSESKRRSLQNMPYYSDDQKSPTKSIARVRKRPSSDLQELRARSSGGFRLARLSVSGARTAPIGLGLPSRARPSPTVASPTRHRRTVSTTPLSLTSLKASCLGVHLKRRRLACCLLGLRFAERHSAYWEEVCEVIRALSSSAAAEMEALRAAIKLVRESDRPLSDLEVTRPVLSIPDLGRRTSIGPTDFAPRQAPEDILLERVEAIRDHLASLWGGVDDLRTRLQSGDDLGDGWATLREQMRKVIREWDKGRAAASLLESQAGLAESGISSEEVSGDSPPDPVPAVDVDSVSEDMPDFLRSWSEGTSSSYNAHEDADTTPPTGSDDEPGLPLPGIDQVFESDLSALPVRGASKLTREERIKMVKEARAKGLNVNLLSRAAQTEGGLDVIANGELEDNNVLMRGGEVVEELKGVIGTIRQRKGLDASADPAPGRQPLAPTERLASIIDNPGVLATPVDTIQATPLGHDPQSDFGGPEVVVPTGRSSSVAPALAPGNVLFPSDDLRIAFVFPTLERHPTE